MNIPVTMPAPGEQKLTNMEIEINHEKKNYTLEVTRTEAQIIQNALNITLGGHHIPNEPEFKEDRRITANMSMAIDKTLMQTR